MRAVHRGDAFLTGGAGVAFGMRWSDQEAKEASPSIKTGFPPAFPQPPELSRWLVWPREQRGPLRC